MKNILVTGAAGGMCRGINERLAEAGYRVLCADTSLAAAEAAAAAVRAVGGDAAAFVLDVTRGESVRDLARVLTESGLEVHGLVNAAGVLDRKYLADHDDDSFDRAIGVNLTGPFRMIQEFGPQMVARQWGRIINISSIAGVTGYPYPSYAASKAGLSNLTRSLLVDFWGTGVTVNAICPGVVDTPMVIQAVRDQVRKRVPTEQIIDPDEIGAAVAYLLSEDARSINGVDLRIDGGATAVFQLFDRD